MSEAVPRRHPLLVGLVTAAAMVLVAYLGMNVLLATSIQPLGFDDSFNLTVAQSLADDFVYQTTLIPRNVYDKGITTNGPIQYLAALNIKLFGNGPGLAVALAIVSSLALVAILLYSWRSFLAAVALIVFYPAQGILMTKLLGEFAAVGLLMLGAAFVIRIRPMGAAGQLLDRTMMAAAVSFGMAASVKLVAAVILPFLVLSLIATAPALKTEGVYRAVKRTVLILVISGAVFLALYYFSVWHSQIALAISASSESIPLPVIDSLVEFVQEHMKQQSVADIDMLSLDAYSSRWILPLVVTSVALLLVASRGWVPWVAMVVVLLVMGDLNERRIYPAIVMTLLLAAANASLKVGGMSRYGRPGAPSLVGALSVVLVGMWVLAISTSLGFPFQSRSHADSSLAWPVWDSVRETLDEPKYWGDGYVVSFDTSRVADAIRETTSPVLISGWWQYSEVQLASGVSFYDRMALETQDYLAGSDPLLLFDPGQTAWPETSIEMCSEVLLRLDHHVLCVYDSTLPLNHRWGIE